jgi:hypothetical protein
MRIKKPRGLDVSHCVTNRNMITGISKRLILYLEVNYHRRIDNIKEILETIFRADIK